MSGNNPLAYIRDHWHQIYRWIREGFNNSIVNQGNIALLDDNVSDLVTNISFNPVTSQITFSYVDLDGNTVSNTIDLSSLSQSPFQIVAIVDTFDDIAAAVPSPNLFEFVRVRNSQGTQWLPGSLGGTYQGAGLYMWDGVAWENDDDEIYEALSKLINTNNVYEVYELGTTSIGAIPTIIDFNTEREASSTYSLAGGVITVNAAIRELTVEYSCSPDRTINNRAICEHQLFLNNAAYPGSISYSYHRTLDSGEGTATKKVTFNNLVPTDTIDLRSTIISGNTGVDLVTKSGASNLVIEIKVPI